MSWFRDLVCVIFAFWVKGDHDIYFLHYHDFHSFIIFVITI